jgi:hypothetical protein
VREEEVKFGPWVEAKGARMDGKQAQQLKERRIATMAGGDHAQ